MCTTQQWSCCTLHTTLAGAACTYIANYADWGDRRMEAEQDRGSGCAACCVCRVGRTVMCGTLTDKTYC